MITWGSMQRGKMTTKTKITIGLTAAGAIALILLLKYWASKKGSGSSGLPVTSRISAAGLGTDVPVSTPQAITEGAYNQAPSGYDNPIDDMNTGEDTGVLNLM